MIRIKFKGNEYIFVGDSLDQDGAIATEEALATGEVSFAHWHPENDMISQFGVRIGGRADIEILSTYTDTGLFAETAAANPLDALLGRDGSWSEATRRSIANKELFREALIAMEREGIPRTEANVMGWYEWYQNYLAKGPLGPIHVGQSTNCPECSKPLGASINANPNEQEPPKEGCFSVCAHCGAKLIFEKDGTLRSVTPEELVEYFMEDPEGYQLLIRASRKLPSIIAEIRKRDPFARH